MSNYLTTDTDLIAVANAIRAKGGTSSSLSFPNGYVSAIQDIQTGGNLKSITIKPENCASSSTQITPETYICETDSSYPGTVISMSATYCNIGNYLDSNIKIELNKTYHCVGQLFIKWDNDDTEEYYYIDSDFNVSSYSNVTTLPSFTWEGSAGATQTFNSMKLSINATPYGYKTYMRPMRNTSVTKSGVLLPGSFYRITQVDTNGYDTINLDFNSDPRFYGIYASLAYRSRIASSAPSVSEWCNSLSSFTIQQFAGQPFSGNFTFNNIGFIPSYAFGSVYNGIEAGTWGYFGLNFPSCTSIYAAAFTTNLYLQSVSFPECITIGNSAFQNCRELVTISFPKCTTIGSYAFSNCTSLTTVSFPECTTIGLSVFQYCKSLTTISFSKCTSIGNYAFYSCSNLTTISFPECINIGNNAFSNCTKLTTVSFPECTSIGTSAFQTCINLTNISAPKVTYIGVAAFFNCKALASVDFPSLSYIAQSCYIGCTSLETCFASTATWVGQAAFSGCYTLKNLSLPECYLISSYGFNQCRALETVSFPKLTEMKGYAFSGCSKLSQIYLMGSSIPTIYSTIFAQTPIVNSTYLGYYGSIYVPSSLLTSYQTATNWATYSARMVGI